MKTQVFNPYLPLWEYVPDGEPHLFEGRVYVYGSHDKAHGTKYCEGDYVVWSAPQDDLSDWRCEGVGYRKDQDPSNMGSGHELWAPDVTCGPDGRYYLYYCLSFVQEIGVGVSDSPAGPFTFYGHVHHPESMGGAVLREHMPFDPAVLTDQDGRVYLYYGFAPAKDKEMKTPNPDEMDIPEDKKEELRAILASANRMQFSEYSMVAELEPDMLTLKEAPRELIPGGHHEEGTGFEGHAFFEASSIRRIGDRYYFVYSSYKSHELCYAVSEHPDRGFVYGGTIVSNGDIGLNGRTKPVNILGNNHGGLVEANGSYYIFYHRQTNGTEYSRQGCAERVTILPDGSIPQVEITSCGLNDGPIEAEGCYSAAIACHITDPTTKAVIDYGDAVLKTQTRITATEDSRTQFVTDITDGSCVGYKYFEFKGGETLSLKLEGDFKGIVLASADEDARQILGEATVDGGEVQIPLDVLVGAHALYLHFKGTGTLKLYTLSFTRQSK